MPDPLTLTDAHLLEAFHPVAKSLSGMMYSQCWDLQIFATVKGHVTHAVQPLEGVLQCHHCQAAITCPAVLYLMAGEVRA